MQKFILKIAAYIISIILSLTFFLLAANTNNQLITNWLLSISAAFIFIPLALIGFEAVQRFSQRKLKKELFEYAKKDVDNIILSILAHLGKLINLSTGTDLKSLVSLLRAKQKELKSKLSKANPLGFQIFKEWRETEKNFSTILNNPFSLKIFNDEQIIVLIQLVKSLRSLEFALWRNENFEKIGLADKSFCVVKGVDITYENINFPYRYLLIEEIKKGRGITRDYGDFKSFLKEQLLVRYKFTEEGINSLSREILDMTNLINRWLQLTGDEFLYDPRIFRMRYKGS